MLYIYELHIRGSADLVITYKAFNTKKLNTNMISSHPFSPPILLQIYDSSFMTNSRNPANHPRLLQILRIRKNCYLILQNLQTRAICHFSRQNSSIQLLNLCLHVTMLFTSKQIFFLLCLSGSQNQNNNSPIH